MSQCLVDERRESESHSQWSMRHVDWSSHPRFCPSVWQPTNTRSTLVKRKYSRFNNNERLRERSIRVESSLGYDRAAVWDQIWDIQSSPRQRFDLKKTSTLIPQPIHRLGVVAEGFAPCRFNWPVSTRSIHTALSLGHLLPTEGCDWRFLRLWTVQFTRGGHSTSNASLDALVDKATDRLVTLVNSHPSPSQQSNRWLRPLRARHAHANALAANEHELCVLREKLESGGVATWNAIVHLYWTARCCWAAQLALQEWDWVDG